MTDRPPKDLAALNRYIEKRYHAVHREQLPVLAQMAERVESAPFRDDHVPEGPSDFLERIIGKIEAHMKKEELILLPAIRKGGMPGIKNPIAVMRADHDDHAVEVAEIRRLSGDPTLLPKGTCGTRAALYDGPTEFLADLEEHMRLENDVLFAQFEPN